MNLKCDETCKGGDNCTNSRIYISGLPKGCTSDDITDMFGGLGTIARERPSLLPIASHPFACKDLWHAVLCTTFTQTHDPGTPHQHASGCMDGWIRQEWVYGWDIRLGAISRNLPQSPAISRDLKWSRGLGETGLAVLAHIASRNSLGTQ